MTLSSSLEKTTSFSFSKIALRLLPEGNYSQTIFWYLLPTLLIFLTLGLSFLTPCCFTPFLPLISFFGIVASVRWKSLGIAVSYLFLCGLIYLFYRQIPSEDQLWQMGILFSIAITFYIALLASEEVAVLLFSLDEKLGSHESILQKAVDEHKEAEERWNEEKKEIEEELKRWKEEAEQRRIEKQADERRFSLIYTEIEMLTEQKESLIEEAFKARADSEERLRQLEKNTQELQQFSANYQPLCEANENLKNENETLVNLISEKDRGYKETEASLFSLKNSYHQLNQDYSHLKNSLESFQVEKREFENAKETLEKDLCEKECTLLDFQKKMKNLTDLEIKLREEKSFLEEKNQSLVRDLAENKFHNASLSEEIKKISILLATKEEDKKALEEQMKAFNALHEQLVADFQAEKEKAKNVAIVTNTREFEVEKARLEGLYQQLRCQFEEKSRMLNQTRKELFHTQGKLSAIENDQLLHPLDPSTDAYLQEIQKLQHLLNELDQENLRLELEINEMEALIFQLLTQ